MGRIGKTIEELNRYGQQWLAALPGGQAEAPVAVVDATTTLQPELVEVTDFEPNPGQLRMFVHVPKRLPARPALVVVLHGCRQTAQGYDLGTGWSQIAERDGFIVCLPEQRGGNNPQQCFNWFTERSTTRGSGEAGSIAAMVEHLAVAHDVDRKRIFVTGLSAGGAMTATMLATYPEVFAAGAVIAGLPYRAAVSVGGALDVMSNGDRRSAADAADAVRGASEHAGPWPRLSVWHGTADETVTKDNAAALIAQWRELTGVRSAPSREESVRGQVHRVWLSATGAEQIEEYELADFGHGAPLDVAALGQAGPFLLEAGISSTLHIAEFFGLGSRHDGIIERVLRAARV
ncbi:MAG: Esterase [Hyphomicrobiales bacterium]|nr:Esterase [Hyphomicrobiales bacterium]